MKTAYFAIRKLCKIMNDVRVSHMHECCWKNGSGSDILKKNCTLYKSVTAALLLNALKCNRTRENYVGLTWMY